MNRTYADKRNVVKSIHKHIEESPEDEGDVKVLDTDAKIVALDEDVIEQRNLWSNIDRVDDGICVIEWERNSFGSPFLTLSFHENVVENDFTLSPAGPQAIDAQQATNPKHLGRKLRQPIEQLEQELDAIFTFAEVSAASMANGGHYTDFEFEYSIDATGL